MLREMCKSKLHLATITETHLAYRGSITIDEALMEQANILANERVQVVNVNTGARFDTYVIRGERGKGTIGLNGAAARLGEPGDKVIIISYCLIDDAEARGWKPTFLILDSSNGVERVL